MSPSQPSEEIIDQVAELLQSQVGLRPESTLRGRLRRCIRDEAAGRGEELESYLQTLSGNVSLLQSLLNRITVQETSFFRHPEHFEVLASDILPNLPQPIRIWSAGCANGQEAFSLAMLLDEQGLDGSVTATDVSTKALQRARKAQYTTREVAGLSPSQIARHLVPAGQSFAINQSLQSRVSTLHHNLIDPVPDQARSCQVVFCRNVLIYFSPQHARSFLDRVAQALPAAWLFLGSAETIWSLGDRFETIRIGKTYAYRPLRPRRAMRTVDQATARPVRSVPSQPSRTSREYSPAVSAAAATSEIRKVTPAPAPGVRTLLPFRLVNAQSVASEAAESDSTAIARLTQTGQQALAKGDVRAAVVMFRKWVYLAQDDALAHLHLALALEADGDQPSAQRAFAAARRILQVADPSQVEHAIDGYATAELHKLLDAKQQGPTR